MLNIIKSGIKYCTNFVTDVTFYIFIHPLKSLYMKGPAILGFWENSPEEEICYKLTNVDVSFWKSLTALAKF